MAPTCRICGRGLGQISGYLQRVNEKGVPGVWECSPTCDADLPTETALFMAVEGGDEQVGKTQVALAYDYMDEPVTESERAKVARKHQLPLRGEEK